MRLITTLSIITVSVYSKLHSACQNDNLILTIPYPSVITKNEILKLGAGNCTSWGEKNDGFEFEYDTNLKAANLTIPILHCNLKTDLYEVPVTRTASLYRPTANITFGKTIQGHEFIFRHMPIAAECGEKTKYKVQFNYNGIQSTDTDDCQLVDEVCVFDSTDDKNTFQLIEYESEKYEKVAEETRAKFAGEIIYLQVNASVQPRHKFAVADCTIRFGDESFQLFEPASENGSCELTPLDLKAEYKNGNFNFQHRLFLQNDMILKLIF